IAPEDYCPLSFVAIAPGRDESVHPASARNFGRERRALFYATRSVACLWLQQRHSAPGQRRVRQGPACGVRPATGADRFQHGWPRVARTGGTNRRMSLINDALKRAKQAQPNAPRPTISGLSLHPVESSRRPGFMIPVITLAAVGLVLLFGWRVFLKGSPAQSQSHFSPPLASEPAGRPAGQIVAQAPPPPAVSRARPQGTSVPATPA